MAPPTRRRRPGRTLLVLAVIAVALFGSLIAGTKFSDASLTPGLALDLEGGTQIILAPVAEDQSAVTKETIQQAIEVIRQRVDSSGVSEAEITSQGGSNIVVALPGQPDEATLELVRTSAQMEFRPVLTYGAPTPTDAATDGATDAATDGATDAATDAATDGTTVEPSQDATDTPDAAATDTPTDAATEPSDEPTTAAPTSPSDSAYYITPAVQAAYDALDCTDSANTTGGKSGPADKALVTCDPKGTIKYILGPVEVKGSSISSASSGLKTTSTGAVTNEWVVNLGFDKTGSKQFRDVTTRLQGLTSPQNQFAIVLDGLVISAPSLDPGVIITDGKAEISGSFDRESSTALANQLKFGALPLTFEVRSQEQISATLGSEQLEKGLIAGLIGLVLVVLYSLFQYRALGFVTVASLVLAGILTYGMISLLSWTQGYRLSLPGVTGLIVAIGITADSFIVYFERIRDELREGRTLVAAVDRGWERARRTILASDAVNFLAAVVLYLLAVGGVRGFAFTLGLTTLLDLLIVFLFTHPTMMLVARTRFFGDGHRWSGLDPRRLGAPEDAGARYVGRGRVATGARRDASETESLVGASVTAGSASGVADVVAGSTPVRPAATGPATSGLTIAERRAAARAAQEAAATSGENDETDPLTSAPSGTDPSVDAAQPDATEPPDDATPADGRRKGSEG